MTSQNNTPVPESSAPKSSAPDGAALTLRQQQLLNAARKEIEADPHFKNLSGATFDHAEVTPGLDETERGYLYLRYNVPGGTPQEFWAHVSGYVGVKWRTGEVSVPVD